MWTRKQQIIVALVLFLVLLLFSSSSQIVGHASKVAIPYAPWTKKPTIVDDMPTHPYISQTTSITETTLPGGAPTIVDAMSTHPYISQTTSITETTLPGGAPAAGFTIFDRMYVRNGTIYAITSNPGVFPNLKLVLSQAWDLGSGRNMDPTPREMQIISPDQAKPILGDYAVVIDGMSVILYDTKQFMGHYYHWWGEIILGIMRVHTGLSLVPGIQKPLPEISRFILPHVPDQRWRDRAGVNGPLMRAGFPSTSIERMDFWEDLVDLNQTFVFERAMIVNREAAHKSPLSGLWFKMVSGAMNATVPDHFWEPLRKRLVRNILGYLPVMNNSGVIVSPPKSSVPIVTYISRQSTTRRLTYESHDSLVEALKGLEAEGLCQVNVALMEAMAFSQQIETVARSTIIIGVHGNGLTHQIWMQPSPRSTVLEIFYPKSYVHDYAMLARNMGHKHYAVWNDTTQTYPPGQWFKGVDYGDSKKFHGSTIPVHGPTVAQVVRERLTIAIP